MTKVSKDRGSFRDPSGRIYLTEGRIYRTVMPRAVSDFDFVRSTEVWRKLLEDELVLPEVKVDPEVLGGGGVSEGAEYVLEHPRLSYVSYPYEWSFPLLKAAALLHLEVQICALEGRISLSDATAYNIQFQGPKPIFIDHLSFRPYRDGEYWIGHRQFCEQFLNPLLLRSVLGVSHNAWYRGSQEGISVSEINRLIPWRNKFSWNILSNVVLQSRFQASSLSSNKNKKVVKQRDLPQSAYRQMLIGLRNWIEKLEPADTGKTVWGDYAKSHSYTDQEVAKKKQCVRDFVQTGKFGTLWDIGCNTGDYSKVAIEAGAEQVIGFDFDQKALELAYSRAISEELPFLPLFLDAANPSPDQGWAQSERMGFSSRQTPDAIIALALVHHLAIGKNIPLDVVDWLVGFSPSGIIEFVPKNDEMVQELLKLREDILDDYNKDSFSRSLESRANVIRTETISSSGRCLFFYHRFK